MGLAQRQLPTGAIPPGAKVLDDSGCASSPRRVGLLSLADLTGAGNAVPRSDRVASQDVPLVPNGGRLSKVRNISVDCLGVPFTEHFEQPVSVAHCLYGVSLVRRLDGIFKPGRDAWICKDFFKSHNQVYSWLSGQV